MLGIIICTSIGFICGLISERIHNKSVIGNLKHKINLLSVEIEILNDRRSNSNPSRCCGDWPGGQYTDDIVRNGGRI